MGRRMTGTVDLTLDSLAEFPSAARSCVYWELDAAAASRAGANGAGALEKEAWLSNTLLEWGTCGKAVYADGNIAGFAVYAPPAYVPRAGGFPTSPAAADSVILMALMVFPPNRGHGLGSSARPGCRAGSRPAGRGLRTRKRPRDRGFRRHGQPALRSPDARLPVAGGISCRHRIRHRPVAPHVSADEA